MTFKQCFKCLKTFPISCFYIHKAMSDGHLGKCKECTKSDVADVCRRNPERTLGYKLKHAAENPGSYLLWRKINPKQVPGWYGELDEFVWQEIRELVRRRTKTLGVAFECDHIIPLGSPTVSGLHYFANWRVVPRGVNRSKALRYAP